MLLMMKKTKTTMKVKTTTTTTTTTTLFKAPTQGLFLEKDLALISYKSKIKKASENSSKALQRSLLQHRRLYITIKTIIEQVYRYGLSNSIKKRRKTCRITYEMKGKYREIVVCFMFWMERKRTELCMKWRKNVYKIWRNCPDFPIKYRGLPMKHTELFPYIM
jgi:hypothetical protein